MGLLLKVEIFDYSPYGFYVIFGTNKLKMPVFGYNMVFLLKMHVSHNFLHTTEKLGKKCLVLVMTVYLGLGYVQFGIEMCPNKSYLS